MGIYDSKSLSNKFIINALMAPPNQPAMKSVFVFLPITKAKLKMVRQEVSFIKIFMA